MLRKENKWRRREVDKSGGKCTQAEGNMKTNVQLTIRMKIQVESGGRKWKKVEQVESWRKY